MDVVVTVILFPWEISCKTQTLTIDLYCKRFNFGYRFYG